MADYHPDRPQRTLGLETPQLMIRALTGPSRSRPVLTGLHYVYTQYVRLSGIFVLDEATAPARAVFALNREARHPLPQERP